MTTYREPADPPTSQWTVHRSYGIAGPDGERLWCHDANQEPSADVAARVAAALNAGHPNPADTEPTAERPDVFRVLGSEVAELMAGYGWPEVSVPDINRVLATANDILKQRRAALMREGDDSRG